jgi:DNA polymerase-1
MAHFSNEPELVEAFNNDLDIHTRTAALVYSVEESEVTTDQRRAAKVVNFGIMYGAGPFRMSKELGISMKDAKVLIDTYFNTYPGIQKYIQETIEEAHLRGYVNTLNGRKRYSQSLGSTNMNVQKAEERALINMPIQGTAAELIKIAMININKKMIDEGYEAKMILQIHDELIFEVPKYEIENFSKLVKFEMENAMKLSVPLKVDYNSGPSWYDAH